MHRVLGDDLFEDVPHLRGRRRSTMRLADLMFWASSRSTRRFITKGLNSSSAMSLGRPHWCSFSCRAGHDDRTTRVVDALAEQVLAEPTLLALQHVGQRLERAVARARHRPAATAVVEQRVDGFLQHALFVVHDDLGSPEIEQALEPVVPVDHAAVQVVEVGRGEAATVELHHRAQFRRDHRDDFEDHGLRVVGPAALLVATVERRDDLQPLDRLLLALGAERLLAVLGIDGLAEADLFDVEVDAVDQAP